MKLKESMELLRESNPVPRAEEPSFKRRWDSARVRKLVLVLLGIMAIGVGASWAATGKDPIEILISDLKNQGASNSLIDTVRKDADRAPDGTVPGPVIEPDEIHVPAEPPEPAFVSRCKDVLSGDGRGDILCMAVLLRDADEILGGVYRKESIEMLYERWRREGN